MAAAPRSIVWQERLHKMKQTLEARIEDAKTHDSLREMNAYLAMVSRNIWVEYYVKKRGLAEV